MINLSPEVGVTPGVHIYPVNQTICSPVPGLPGMMSTVHLQDSTCSADIQIEAITVTPAIKEMIGGKEVKTPDAFYRLKIQEEAKPSE